MRRILSAASLLIIFIISPVVHAQSWVNQADMKLKRSESSAVEYNGELYVFNGFSRGLFVGNSVEKYNPNTKKWTLLGNTSVANGTAVTHTGTVRVGADVWLLGGRVGAHPGRVTSDVWIYNINSKQWRKGPKLPRPMAGGGAALVNNKIYMFGGVDAQAKCDVNFHYAYNLNSPNAGWKDLTASAGMPLARNHFSTVVLNNLIYAIGGQNGHDGCPGIAGGNVPFVHAYNPANNSWKRLANLPAAESHSEPSTFVHNGFIYMVGGAGAGNKVIRYDRIKNNWTQVATLPQKLLAPVARVYNGKLIVGGGGAPKTSLSIPTVRSLTSGVFNDKLGGGQSPVVSEPEPEPAAEPAPAPNPEPTPQPEPQPSAAPPPEPTPEPEPEPVQNVPASASPQTSNTGPITVNGNVLSWPDNGWYQVQTMGDFREVCAGGRSCEVPSGSYLVINHSNGERVRDVQVGQTQLNSEASNSESSNTSSNEGSPISVNGQVISWPDNGWYQVQDENDNHAEVCAGTRSCLVQDGVYTVINHTSDTRYEGIVIGDISFAQKLASFENRIDHAAGAAFVQVNQQYSTGSLSDELAQCLPNTYDGQASALIMACDSQINISNTDISVTHYEYSGSGGYCLDAVENAVAENCTLSSAQMILNNVSIGYRSLAAELSNESTGQLVLSVVEMVADADTNNVDCMVQLHADDSWTLGLGSDFNRCNALMDQLVSE